MFPGLVVGIKKTGLSKSRSADENVCFTKTANVTHQILFCQGTSWQKISYSETCLKSFRPQKSWNELNYTFSELNNCIITHTHLQILSNRQSWTTYLECLCHTGKRVDFFFFFFWQQSVPNFATSVHPEHLLRVVTTCIILEGLYLSISVLLALQHDPVPKTHTAGGG